MALSNSERQARHRERVKAKLAADIDVAEIGAEPRYVTDSALLDEMNAAFEEAHAKEVLRVVEWADGRDGGPPGEGDPWFERRANLLRHPGFMPQAPEAWVKFARSQGEKLGNYLALSLRSDALSESIQRIAPPKPAPKPARKRVT